jgi:hypothetical protein
MASSQEFPSHLIAGARSLSGVYQERFTLHILLGKPKESKLQTAYIQAQNILHKMPCKHEFVQEDEAENFAEGLKNGIKEHDE